MRLLFKYASVFIIFLLLWSCNRDKIVDPVDDSIPLATPSDLNILAAHDGQVGIEWKGNNETNLKGYFIYRSINRTDRFKQTAFTDQNFSIMIRLTILWSVYTYTASDVDSNSYSASSTFTYNRSN